MVAHRARDREAHVRIGAVIRDLRRGHKWSQAELAKFLDVHQTFVSKVELGERRLNLPEAVRVARVFGISVMDIIRQADVGGQDR